MDHKTVYKKRKAQFYNELKSTIDKSKISYTELSKNLPMYTSKQAFGQALNNQTLKLEALFAIAEALDKQLLIRFSDNLDAADWEQTLHDPDSNYARRNQKLAECQEQLETRDQIIRDLRDNLRDKQVIIDILQKQIGDTPK